MILTKGGGSMDDDWIKCTVADACSSIDYGLTASASDNPVGPRFLRITDIVQGHIVWDSVPYVEQNVGKKYRLHDGDIVLARTGASTGASAYVKSPPPAVFASYLVRLQATPEFDALFLAYYLKSTYFLDFIHSILGDKSAQPNASASTMTKAPFCAPKDIKEQRRIAHILGTLDDKIENNRKTAKTLEAMAQAIFKSWFVDFDPVRAKMAGESRESICKRLKLTPEILDLFPDRLVDSELGEIPDGWEVGMLDNLAALVTDSTSPGRSPHTVFEHYSIPAFDAGRTPAMELGESIKSNKYVVKHRAVLVSKLNPHTPRIWLPANGDGAAICSTEFMQFVPHEREDRPYLYCLMISQSMQEEVLKHVTGSTGSRQRAQPSQIAKVKILSPQSCVKKVFTHQASPLLHAVAENLTASRTLAALRDALLPRLISGEISAADTHGCSKEILV